MGCPIDCGSIITPVVISPVKSDIGIISIGKGELGIELGGCLSDLGGTRSFDLGKPKGGEGAQVGEGWVRGSAD